MTDPLRFTRISTLVMAVFFMILGALTVWRAVEIESISGLVCGIFLLMWSTFLTGMVVKEAMMQ